MCVVYIFISRLSLSPFFFYIVISVVAHMVAWAFFSARFVCYSNYLKHCVFIYINLTLHCTVHTLHSTIHCVYNVYTIHVWLRITSQHWKMRCRNDGWISSFCSQDAPVKVMMSSFRCPWKEISRTSLTDSSVLPVWFERRHQMRILVKY